MTDDINEFWKSAWLNALYEHYHHTVLEGNPMYEHDNRKLLVDIGVDLDKIENIKEDAFSKLPSERVLELKKLFAEYVPRERHLGKKVSNKKLAKMAFDAEQEKEAPAVPVFGQINPLPKRRGKRT